jgi:hypothetical protein
MASSAYFGKYRARVVDLGDPEERGRIRVECPRVLGDGKSPWCEPCVPVAYDGGGDFCLPKLGDTVWVEFEGGNPQQPIWVGGWWGEGKTPLGGYAGSGGTRVIEYAGARITMKDGGIAIEGDVVFGGKAIIGGKDAASHTHTAQGAGAETSPPN